MMTERNEMEGGTRAAEKKHDKNRERETHCSWARAHGTTLPHEPSCTISKVGTKTEDHKIEVTKN